MISIRNKRGNILTEDIIFIVLNLTFIIILMVFVWSKVGAVAVLEEKYAKQIALIVDAAEPGMTIDLNMKDAIEVAEKEHLDFNAIVKINDNIVTVKLHEGNGYSYSFFNDVEVNVNFDTVSKAKYYFVIAENE